MFGANGIVICSGFANNLQILAWNGGGSSNISEIFGQKHTPDKAAAQKVKDFLKSELENVEQFFDELK